MTRTVKIKTNLLFVDHTPFAGGAQLVLAEHIAQLDKDRYQITVVCTDTVAQLIERYHQAGAEVITIDMPRLKGNPLSLWHVCRAAQQLRRIIQQQAVQIVISNTSRASYIATLAVIGTDTKLIWWIRDFLYSKPLFKLLQWRAAFIICVSQAIKDHYGLTHQDKAHVVYVASNLYQQLQHITAKQRLIARQQWSLDSSDIVVGYMGRLVTQKGPADLVEAMIQLHQAYPKLKALIVGTGRDQENDNEELLHQRVAEAKAESYIKFTGYQTDEALYYSLFDIFVLTTRDAEPFATTVVQAMMANKPVIATDAGGTNELVINQQTGLLIPAGSVDILAQAIASLVDNPQLAHQLSQAGHAQVMAKHTEDIATQQLEQIYHQLLI